MENVAHSANRYNVALVVCVDAARKATGRIASPNCRQGEPTYIREMSGKPKEPRRSRSRKQIRASDPRCIYCSAPVETTEHMPPLSVFKGRQRPSGLEFASCEACNNGTRAADTAVAFLSRIDRFGDDPTTWKVQEALKHLRSMGTLAPGFTNELFDNEKDALLRTPAGILVPVAEIHTGPICQSLLHVFGAKLGMALYREHTGIALPLEGGVHVMWFLNNGLAQETADGMLRILPVHSTLRQGLKKNASGQFDYRFNSDDKSIVAALSHFHSNIHFFTIAMAEPSKFGFPRTMPFSAFVKPGELVKFMPKPAPAIVMLSGAAR